MFLILIMLFFRMEQAIDAMGYFLDAPGRLNQRFRGCDCCCYCERVDVSPTLCPTQDHAAYANLFIIVSCDLVFH